jgi:hypothetical protein
VSRSVSDHRSQARISASQLLWRIGIAGELIMHVCNFPLMLVFIYIVQAVNKNLALLTVLFNLVQTAVLVANELNLLAACFYWDPAPSVPFPIPAELLID